MLQPVGAARWEQRALSWAAGHLMAAAPARWQLPARRTHGIITRQALAMLAADGHLAASAWLTTHEHALVRGVYWADEGWQNVTHFYEPLTGRGLFAWRSAADVITEYAALASGLYARKMGAAAAFYLGGVVHLIQDLCVPHHAGITIRHGHRAYELRGEEQVSRYLVTHGGLDQPWSPAQSLHANALLAQQWLSEPAGPQSGLGAMLERAQKSTAGFLYGFFEAAGPWGLSP